jgi:hypothetical protein
MLTLPDATVRIFDAVSILIKLASPVCVRTGTKKKHLQIVSVSV